MRGALPELCLALLAAERGDRLCAIIHYFVHGQLGWFGLTVTCVVPGDAAQLLSILWFRADGCLPGGCLLVLHLLQLGLWKQYWDVLWMVAKTGSSAGAGEVLTQHGDVCVLHLLEALLQTLPHLPLRAYVVVAVDPAVFIPGVHWLLMSFWLVAQQTDIVAQTCHWRLVAAVYIFCYINVWPGPSKHRVAVFHAIMLTESTLLLLPATRFLQAELRNSLCVTGAVVSGSVIGAAALGVYYSLLHPKSTEICPGFLETTCSAAAAGDDEVAGDSSQDGQSLGISGDEEPLGGTGTRADPKNGNSSSLLQVRGCLESSWTNHHHWLLVKLALKTGDTSTINTAFGDGGMREVYPGTWMGKPANVEPEANLSLPTREIGPGGVACGLSDGKSQVVGNGGVSKPSTSTARAAQEDGAGLGLPPALSFRSSFSLHLAKGSSMYYSASAGGITSPSEGTVPATSMALVQRDSKTQPPPGCLGEGGHGEDLSPETVTTSPILGTCAPKHLQHSSSLSSTGSCRVVGHPKEGLEPVGCPCGASLPLGHPLWHTGDCCEEQAEATALHLHPQG